MEPQTNTQTLLSGKDIREMVGIVGDVAASPGDHSEKKHLLMGSLSSLVAADGWSWMLATKMRPGQNPAFTSISSGGFEEGEFSRILVAQEHADFAKLTEPLAKSISQTRKQITLRRIDYDPSDWFAGCESRPLWNATGVGPPMLCSPPVA